MRELRERRLLNQAELAGKVGVSSTTLSYWETGRRRPRIIHIRKLAEVLEVSTDAVLDAIQASHAAAKGKTDAA